MRTFHFIRRVQFQALVFSVLLFTLQAKAQSYCGLYVQGAFPQDHFRDNAYRDGFGGGFYLMSYNLIERKAKSFGLHLGVNMDYEAFGTKKFKGLQLDSPQVGTATVYFSNSSLNLNGVCRFSFKRDKFTPYLDFGLGARFYFTSQTIRQDDPRKNPSYEESTDNDILKSSALNVSAGLGCIYPLGKQISLDMGLSYVSGTDARYLSLRNIHRDDNEFRYNDSKSPTDLILLRAGILVSLEFNGESSASQSAGEKPHFNVGQNSTSSQKPNKLQKNRIGS